MVAIRVMEHLPENRIGTKELCLRLFRVIGERFRAITRLVEARRHTLWVGSADAQADCGDSGEDYGLIEILHLQSGEMSGFDGLRDGSSSADYNAASQH
jgi:hypothetical protein